MLYTICNVSLGIALAATFTNAAVAQPERRDLPVDHGCIPCQGGDGAYYQAAQKAFAAIDPKLINEGKASFGQTFEAGYQSQLCAAKSVNCVT